MVCYCPFDSGKKSVLPSSKVTLNADKMHPSKKSLSIVNIIKTGGWMVSMTKAEKLNDSQKEEI